MKSEAGKPQYRPVHWEVDGQAEDGLLQSTSRRIEWKRNTPLGLEDRIFEAESLAVVTGIVFAF